MRLLNKGDVKVRVLLFTHAQDIDGAGCAILLRKAFEDYTIVPTETFDVNTNVESYIKRNLIRKYDQVFVTDLCIKEPLLSQIDSDEELRSKIHVIDHHKTEIEEGNDKYDFVDVTVEKDGKKVSGTSLFYEYLVSHGFLQTSPILDQLVEWTRQYDIWEWKKHGNYDARKLHILFETSDFEKYFNRISDKVDTMTSIKFTGAEEAIVTAYDKALAADMDELLKDMKVAKLQIDGRPYRIGYIHCPYSYRNDVDEFVARDNVHSIDAVGMIMKDKEVVSYRRVNEDIDMSQVGKYFGGKGHGGAATHPKSNEKFKRMYKSLCNSLEER